MEWNHTYLASGDGHWWYSIPDRKYIINERVVFNPTRPSDGGNIVYVLFTENNREQGEIFNTFEEAEQKVLREIYTF